MKNKFKCWTCIFNKNLCTNDDDDATMIDQCSRLKWNVTRKLLKSWKIIDTTWIWTLNICVSKFIRGAYILIIIYQYDFIILSQSAKSARLAEVLKIISYSNFKLRASQYMRGPDDLLLFLWLFNVWLALSTKQKCVKRNTKMEKKLTKKLRRVSLSNRFCCFFCLSEYLIWYSGRVGITCASVLKECVSLK